MLRRLCGSSSTREVLSPLNRPWDDVRLDELVGALLAPDGQSVAGLARSARCSPDTITHTRRGRVPRPALRARLIALGWDRLDPDVLASVGLPPEPPENLRWNAWTRFAPEHAFRAELAITAGGVSLCGFAYTDTVSRAWPTEPDAFPAICPTCLARARER